MSRVVNLKLYVLATFDKASTTIGEAVPTGLEVVVAPTSVLSNDGKYLKGTVCGVYDLKVGPDAFVAVAAEFAPV